MGGKALNQLRKLKKSHVKNCPDVDQKIDRLIMAEEVCDIEMICEEHNLSE